MHSPTRSAGSNSLTCTRAWTGQIPGLARPGHRGQRTVHRNTDGPSTPLGRDAPDPCPSGRSPRPRAGPPPGDPRRRRARPRAGTPARRPAPRSAGPRPRALENHRPQNAARQRDRRAGPRRRGVCRELQFREARAGKRAGSGVCATHDSLISADGLPLPGPPRNVPQFSRGHRVPVAASQLGLVGLRRAAVPERAALPPPVPVRGAWFPAETVPQQTARALGSGPRPAPPADPEPAGGNPGRAPSPPPTPRPREPATHAPPRARSPGVPVPPPLRMAPRPASGRALPAPPPVRPASLAQGPRRSRAASGVCAAPEGGAQPGPAPLSAARARAARAGRRPPHRPRRRRPGLADPASPAGRALAAPTPAGGVDTRGPRTAPEMRPLTVPASQKDGWAAAAFPQPAGPPRASPAAAVQEQRRPRTIGRTQRLGATGVRAGAEDPETRSWGPRCLAALTRGTAQPAVHCSL